MSKKALTIVALFLFASVLVFVGCSNHDMHNDNGMMNMGGNMKMNGTNANIAPEASQAFFVRQ